MTQLGFTFYPKDWWTSDTFFALSPFERYIYLELLFMMYVNDGFVQDNKANVERRLGTTIKDDVWVKITDLLVKDGDRLTHKSVNKRLSKAIANRENGKKGGAPKGNKNASQKQPKTTEKQPKTTSCFENSISVDSVNDSYSNEKQPKQPNETTQNNPPYNRNIIEREKKVNISSSEIKEKKNTEEGDFFNLINPPDDNVERNWDRFKEIMRGYKCSEQDFRKITALSNYGAINDPVWALIAEVRNSNGKLNQPVRFILSRLTK